MLKNFQLFGRYFGQVCRARLHCGLLPLRSAQFQQTADAVAAQGVPFVGPEVRIDWVVYKVVLFNHVLLKVQEKSKVALLGPPNTFRQVPVDPAQAVHKCQI